MTHLWEMETCWFQKPTNEHIQSTYMYKSWKEFREYKPYKLWKPYILSSWSWKVMPKHSCEPQLPTKRNETDKHTMNCSTMLRVNPSSYDKERILVKPNTEEMDMLQIVFISPDRFIGMQRVEIIIKREEEELIREWLVNHMPTFWKL